MGGVEGLGVFGVGLEEDNLFFCWIFLFSFWLVSSEERSGELEEDGELGDDELDGEEGGEGEGERERGERSREPNCVDLAKLLEVLGDFGVVGAEDFGEAIVNGEETRDT